MRKVTIYKKQVLLDAENILGVIRGLDDFLALSITIFNIYLYIYLSKIIISNSHINEIQKCRTY